MSAGQANEEYHVYLGLGSNVGQREVALQRAVHLLEANGLRVHGISSVYETQPFGFTRQDDFLNLCLYTGCVWKPESLLKVCKGIEREIGRVPRRRWGPREIDIDILFFSDLIIEETKLTIPHPYMRDRRFVLEALAEIAPDLRCPRSGYTISELLAACQDESAVKCWGTLEL